MIKPKSMPAKANIGVIKFVKSFQNYKRKGNIYIGT